MMEIKFAGSCSTDDYHHCEKLIRRRQAKAARIMIVFLALFFLFLLLIAIMAWFKFLPTIFLLPLASLIVIGCLSWLGYKLLKQYSNRKLLQWKNQTVSFQITENRVHIHTDNNDCELNWNDFNRYWSDESMLLLGRKSKLPSFKINIIPRSFFATDADWNAFVELVKAKVPAR
jgi:hypothetical protein